MIPFASQRGGGQDLATHLMNAHDNEQIELFAVRGAIARDLHGAFAEWEAIAKALTRARQYLCSLSVNPDDLQGRLTRDQYLDYIERAEQRLGLSGQPRAIVFHVKQGDDGRRREHCHVVWSRTDVAEGKAVPLAFFKEKLMTVTREFARDHGLELPAGYHRQEDKLRRRNRQLSGYDGIKAKETGISHEERMAAVTDAWRRSDSGKAFVAALEDLGYVLARGRNRTRIVLVDFYGHTTALTRLIDDSAVRARHVRDFLGAAYAPDDLPSVEEAQTQAAQRRMAIEAFEAARRESEKVTQLARQQAARREQIEAQAGDLRQRHHDERMQLAAAQKAERQALKSAYLATQKRIRIDRARRRPRGLAAFLGRVSGAALVIRKIQRYRDRRRYSAYLVVRDAMKRRQQQERQALASRHALQAADIQRRLRALGQIEQRERESLEQMARKERRQRINGRHAHIPPLIPSAKTATDEAPPAGSRRRRESALAREMAAAAQLLKTSRPQIRLTDTFAQASGDEQGGGGDQAAAGSLSPEPTRKRKKRARRRGRLGRDFRDAASGERDEGEGSGGNAEAPKPAAEPSPGRRRRRKRKPRQTTPADRRGSEQSEKRKAEQEEERKQRQRRRRRRRDPGPGM